MSYPVVKLQQPYKGLQKEEPAKRGLFLLETKALFLQNDTDLRFELQGTGL